MTKQQKDFLSSFFEGLSEGEVETLGANDRGCITMWYPLSTKQKFMRLQEKTKRKLGKRIQKFVKTAIDQCPE